MRKLSLLILLSVTSILAQAQMEKLIRHLPHNANMVISLNPVKIANYIPGDVFRQSNMYREMMKGDKGEIKAFLSNPEIAGIDFSTDLIITIIKDSVSEKEEDVIITILGALKNEALFAAAMQKLVKGEDAYLKTYGTDKIFLTGKASPAIAWNKEIFVLTTGNRASIKREISKQFQLTDEALAADTAAVVAVDTAVAPTQPDFDIEKLYENFQQQLRNYCFELLAPPNQQNLVINSRLLSLLTENADIKFWNNGASSFGNDLGKLPPQVAGIFKKLKIFPGSIRTSVLNFENGKITSTGKNYLTNDQAALFNKYANTGINKTLLTQIPATAEPLLLMTAAMDNGLLKELLASTGVKDIMNEKREEMPFNPELLSAAFGSSGLMAVVKTNYKTSAALQTKKGKTDEVFKNMHLLLAMPVKNKKNVGELKDAVVSFIEKMKKEKEAKKEETEDENNEEIVKEIDIFKGMNIKPAYEYNDSLFVFSTSAELAKSYISNTKANVGIPFAEQTENYPMAVSFSLRNFFNLMYENSGSPSAKDDKDILNMLTQFGDMKLMSGHYENGVLHNKMEMAMGEPNQNALLQLFQFLNKAAEAKEKERREWNEDAKVELKEITMDAETVEPPPPPPPAKLPPSVKVKPAPKKPIKK
jgi:hypothetical protein